MTGQRQILLSYLAGIAFSVASPQVSADENGLFKTNSLTLDAATKAAWGAIEECRRRGYSIAVALVDRGGNVQVVLRDRFAGPHTTETAKRKAWTANSFRQSTSDLAGMLKEGKIPAQVAHNPGALLVGGGLMVVAGGNTIGGIGVSGAPPGKSERDSIDGACAQAGIRKIQEILDFAD